MLSFFFSSNCLNHPVRYGIASCTASCLLTVRVLFELVPVFFKSYVSRYYSTSHTSQLLHTTRPGNKITNKFAHQSRLTMETATRVSFGSCCSGQFLVAKHHFSVMLPAFILPFSLALVYGACCGEPKCKGIGQWSFYFHIDRRPSQRNESSYNRY
jgi:hypothetical protein